MNSLTVRLFAEGYTKDNHPDYVKWSGFREFDYTYKFISEAVWETPCGWFCKIKGYCGWGSSGGVDYRPENDNHLMHCCRPDKTDICPHVVRESIGNMRLTYCPVHLSKRPYDYQHSMERIEDEKEAMRKRFYDKFIQAHPNAVCCACREVDYETNRTVFRYDPWKCINYTSHGCWQEICAVTGRPRDTSLGNLYYDVRVTRHLEQGFLKWSETSINKGIKWFKSQRTISAIEEWLRVNPNEIQQRADGNFRSERIFFDKKVDVVVENIRIEKRPTRDLMQDLADIAEGITVTHNSDLVRNSAAGKKERRAARKEAKLRKAEKGNIKKWLLTVNDESESKAIRAFSRKMLEARGIDYNSVSDEKKEVQLSLWN